MPKRKRERVYGLDSETTGVDFRHGSRPYFLTFCDTDWNNTFFEWDVDPATRKVKFVKDDVLQATEIIKSADRIVIQNAKFDVTAFMFTLADLGMSQLLPEWPWDKTDDTVVMAHLAASNHNKDLNSLAIEYLAINLSPFEDKLEEAVKACHNMVWNKPGWRIAKEGLPEMPSAKDSKQEKKGEVQSNWKFDTWLPRTVALRKLPGWKKEWLTVAQEYGNPDSTACLALFFELRNILQQRGVYNLYTEQTRKEVRVNYEMEQRGITVSQERFNETRIRLKEQQNTSAAVCCNIAKSKGVELDLGKSGNTKSVMTFAFGSKYNGPVAEPTPNLDLPVVVWTEGGKPSLDKFAMEEYRITLPPKSVPYTFINNLEGYRKCGTALGYMESYEKFWLPVTKVKIDNVIFMVLHPSLNQTGTKTLRYSSSSPNEQQISKQEGYNLRYLFGPLPGREWWSMDAKNIELRIPAYASGEQELITLYETPDAPPYYGSVHLLNFSTVYDDIWDKELREVGFDKVGPHCKEKFASSWYQWCKNGGFAVQYGAIEREEGTADRAFHRPSSHAKLKSRFNKLELLNQECIKLAEKQGYVETLPDKSVNPDHGYPLLCTRSQWGHILPTVPLNYKVQGTAMWWTRRAMVHCQEYFDDYNRSKPPEKHAHIALQVHDELVFDFPKGEGPEPWRTNYPVVQELAKVMEKGGDGIGVPTPVGIEYHSNNWSQGITLG